MLRAAGAVGRCACLATAVRVAVLPGVALGLLVLEARRGRWCTIVATAAISGGNTFALTLTSSTLLMSKVVKYQLLTADDPQLLTEFVNGRLESGYTLHGDTFVTAAVINDEQLIVYCQAVVKLE